MRLLHISDWHLGRLTYRCPRTPDHESVLEEILELARDVRPHLICHTGDVFDGLRPGYPEMTRAIDALEELGAVAPVVVVAGNHDSPALFRLFNRGDRPEFLERVDRARHHRIARTESVEHVARVADQMRTDIARQLENLFEDAFVVRCARAAVREPPEMPIRDVQQPHPSLSNASSSSERSSSGPRPWSSATQVANAGKGKRSGSGAGISGWSSTIVPGRKRAARSRSSLVRNL